MRNQFVLCRWQSKNRKRSAATSTYKHTKCAIPQLFIEHTLTNWLEFILWVYFILNDYNTSHSVVFPPTTNDKNEANKRNKPNKWRKRSVWATKKKRMTNCSKSMETIFFSVNGGFVAMLSTRDAGISVQLNRLSFELVLFRYFFFHFIF